MNNLHSQIKTRRSDKPRGKTNKRILLIDAEPNSAVPSVFERNSVTSYIAIACGKRGIVFIRRDLMSLCSGCATIVKKL
jgi:hypothetical protein